MNCFLLPPVIHGLLFDIDNTLYRNDQYCALQVELLIARYGESAGITLEEAELRVDRIRRNYAESHEGRTTSTGNAMVELGVSLEENIVWRNELFHPENYIEPDPLLKSALVKLARKFTLSAVTNNTVEVGKNTLAALDVGGVFNRIVGLDTCLKSKPSREPFVKALDLTGISAGNSISIGDRFDVDIAVPLRMGMGGILIESMDEVYKLPAFLADYA